MILLASCAGANSASDKNSRALVLPEIKEYTKEQQNRVADELEILFRAQQRKPESVVFLKDYHKMIQETRAAQKRLKPKP